MLPQVVVDPPPGAGEATILTRQAGRSPRRPGLLDVALTRGLHAVLEGLADGPSADEARRPGASTWRRAGSRGLALHRRHESHALPRVLASIHSSGRGRNPSSRRAFSCEAP